MGKNILEIRAQLRSSEILFICYFINDYYLPTNNSWLCSENKCIKPIINFYDFC